MNMKIKQTREKREPKEQEENNIDIDQNNAIKITP